MTSISSKDDDFVIEQLSPSQLSPNPSNSRKHSQKQITRLKAVISEFGFTNPILIDERSKIIAGHGRLEAAIGLKLKTVPCVRLTCLRFYAERNLALKIGPFLEEALPHGRIHRPLRENFPAKQGTGPPLGHPETLAAKSVGSERETVGNSNGY